MSSAEVKKSPVHDGEYASQPTYREFPPGQFLAASIECFWTSTVRTAPRISLFHRVLPDGCMDLLFDFMTVGSRRASIIGTMTRPLTITTTGPVDLLGVRFRPGGLSAFLTFDAAELTNARGDLTSFWGHLAEEIWHRLGEATPTARVWLLQEMLNARAKERIQTDPFVHHCVTRIEAAHGDLRIGELEKSTGLSTRQLERKFARHLGISPKTFSRVVRFKSVASLAAKSEPPDWVTLAGDFGYSDQPHLVREFKAFSGLTPVDYLEATNNPR
jgi:AraC-like DNA-binding protein